MNKSHRDIKGESIVNLKQRIEEIGEEKREVYVHKPIEKKGSWVERFFLDRVWDFITRSFEFKADADFKDGHIHVEVFVAIAGRTIFSDTIKVI
ncbi:hypothetical protein [Gracilimonas sp.]|uniref:hypothetical protein n=1 Tax=Gracilimonas sp. TaxID=1974203 RepID=UPI002870D6A2|nr:hypothetical protein [Gracilimonas sp.]